MTIDSLAGAPCVPFSLCLLRFRRNLLLLSVGGFGSGLILPSSLRVSVLIPLVLAISKDNCSSEGVGPITSGWQFKFSLLRLEEDLRK